MEGFSNLLVCFNSPGERRSTHTIYCKAHSLKKTSACTPNGRTLFTLGWPPYVDCESLKELFSRAGHVTDVILQLKGGPVEDVEESEGFKVGYIVMSSDNELSCALRLCSGQPVPCPTRKSLGLAAWCKDYQHDRLSIETLESSVAMAMDKYDVRVEADKMEKKRAAQPDEDGWITVSNKQRKLSEDPGLKATKRKKKELVNFYSWQLRESQRNEIARLRQRFEEDRLRVASLKAARRFRPY